MDEEDTAAEVVPLAAGAGFGQTAALMGIAPIALVATQSVQFPLDLVLGLALPLHGHIGMNQVITDYAKKVVGKGGIGPARLAMAGFTGVTTLGLLKLNLTGPGLIETVKGFWKPKA